MSKRRKSRKQQPADQATRPGVSPISGVAPPAEHQFPPGQSGNPAGRPKNAGSTVIEWVNQFVANGLTAGQLRKIADDEDEAIARRAAADWLVGMIEKGNMADFEAVLTGTKTLEELRAEGRNTGLVKKMTVKTKRLAGGGEEPEEIVERQIELVDRRGECSDRVADRTDGKPTQVTKLTSDGSFRPEPIILNHTAPPPSPTESSGG